MSIYRSQLSYTQHSLNYEDVIERIEKYLVDNYHEDNIVKTLQECLVDLHIAPKTYYKYKKKYNISYSTILSKNHISKMHSKFQTSITNYIRQLYSEYEIIEEMTFDDCVNPKTKYPLKFDIYIKDLNIAVECDGIQHYKKDAYFNQLAEKNGYTPTYITDLIKSEYCREKNIKLIRIPYVRVVTKKYVASYIYA